MGTLAKTRLSEKNTLEAVSKPPVRWFANFDKF